MGSLGANHGSPNITHKLTRDAPDRLWPPTFNARCLTVMAAHQRSAGGHSPRLRSPLRFGGVDCAGRRLASGNGVTSLDGASDRNVVLHTVHPKRLIGSRKCVAEPASTSNRSLHKCPPLFASSLAPHS